MVAPVVDSRKFGRLAALLRYECEIFYSDPRGILPDEKCSHRMSFEFREMNIVPVVPVVIVGAGPAGLVLALSLARYEIHSTILERQLKIGEDPRGVYLAGDAVRVLYQLGLGDQMGFIGHEAEFVNFHCSSFKNEPFFRIPTQVDWSQQVVPTGVYQIQPRLEATLREKVNQSSYCHLQLGCEVVSREELPDRIVVKYNENNTIQQVRAFFLIGADGKTGIVRKRFLEDTADVRQEAGLFSYYGTWVAANLQITLPTSESHPGLCFWNMSMTPEDVYDLFWPANWHFCNPPGKATACGRFGPVESRYWRHEFAEPDWNESKDATKLMWEHLSPMITRNADRYGRPFADGNVAFPHDCIKIIRCRPFTFSHKVVNKWFHNRTILIGDAAHVFPPFGGQGIACGIRDGDALAWRLAMLLRLPNITKAKRDKVLQAWSAERRQGVDSSARLTMMNGQLANEPETWGFYIFRKIEAWLRVIPGAPTFQSMQHATEVAGYKSTRDGFFLSEYGGGCKIAQIYVKSLKGHALLSDEMLKNGLAFMTILVLNGNSASDCEEVRAVLRRSKVASLVIPEKAVVLFSSNEPTAGEKAAATMTNTEWYWPCPENELQRLQIRQKHSVQSYLQRFPQGTGYAIIRPDLIIFLACKTIWELQASFDSLEKLLGV